MGGAALLILTLSPQWRERVALHGSPFLLPLHPQGERAGVRECIATASGLDKRMKLSW
jgi:hypothetical protein